MIVELWGDHVGSRNLAKTGWAVRGTEKDGRIHPLTHDPWGRLVSKEGTFYDQVERFAERRKTE